MIALSIKKVYMNPNNTIIKRPRGHPISELNISNEVKSLQASNLKDESLGIGQIEEVSRCEAGRGE